ncbi:speckle-type POZ protein-like [Planococcus citri]|uniref:speckle-type POZ protein-like n=1 Tax=Planococcus citri TaxID=170843 RepID=UPI0031F9AAA8
MSKRNRILKTIAFSWNIDSPEVVSTPSTFSSPVFSSVDDDLKWHLEFTKPGLDVGLLQDFTSVTLHIDHENGFFTKYKGISGKVKLFLMTVRNNCCIITKEKKFEIQNTAGNTSPRIEFPGFTHDYVYWKELLDPLTIICNVTYVTTGKICKNPAFSVCEDFENLLADKQFSDVIIKVQDKEYPVYKGILAARSAYFRAMFRENNDMIENTTNVVDLSKSKIRPEVFEELLRFIYSGKVNNLDTLAYELLPAADMYQLKELMEMCEETLFQQFSKDNVIKILILAHEYNADWLKTEALEFVKLHSRYADLKNTKIWEVLTSHRDLMEDLVAVLLDK